MRPRLARPGLAAAIVLMTVVLVHGDAFAYTLNQLGRVGAWDNINRAPLVSTVIDQSDLTTDNGLSAEAVNAALGNAYNTWASVPGATNLEFELLADDGGNYDAFDGAAIDTDANWRYADIVMGGWLEEDYFLDLGGANILAVTWTTKLRGDGSPKPAWHVEIFFNDAFDWTDGLSACAGCIDIETVFLHELGHAIGFGHENSLPSIMDDTYFGVERTLYETDIDGVVNRYSRPGGGAAPGLELGALSAEIYTLPIPEPGSLAVFGLGLAVLGLLRRRRAA